MDEHKKRILVFSRKANYIQTVNDNLKFFFSEVSVLGTHLQEDIRKFLMKDGYKIDAVIGTSDLLYFLYFKAKYFTDNFESVKFIFYPSNPTDHKKIADLVKRNDLEGIILMEPSISMEDFFPLKSALEKLGVFVSKIPPQNMP